jgi:protein TonB
MLEGGVLGGRSLLATLMSLVVHVALLGGLALAQRSIEVRPVTIELVPETRDREPQMEPKPVRPPAKPAPPPPEPRRERKAAVEPPAVLPPEPAPPPETPIASAPPPVEAPSPPRPAETETARPARPAGPRAESLPGPISALPSAPSPGPSVSTPAAPAPAASPAPHAAVPRDSSGGKGFSGPRVDRQRQPRYPDAARREGVEGVVLVKALVQPDGGIGAVEVERSSGHAVLDQAAVQAIRDWRFRPAERNGARVEAWVVVSIHFKIER